MSTLKIKEIFYSLQGEGFHTGTPAWFIRFSGCDIGCSWCDTKDAWNPDDSVELSIDDILNQLNINTCHTVVITGGEPLYQYDKLAVLSKALNNKGFQVHLETSGAYPFQGKVDWLCLSPKRIMPVREDIIPLANEIKFVISNEVELEFARQFVDQHKPAAMLFLQPEWRRRNKIIPLLVDFIKSQQGWRLSLQTHKYIQIP